MRTILFIFLAAAAKSIASPQGLVVAKGDVTLNSNSAESFTISASDQAILNWSDFSIDLNERVEFIQPSFDAIAINRVIEPNPSRIFGQLSSNGKLILVNPHGVFVGKEAIIDTGSWIASTLDLNSDVFLKTEELEFEGNSENGLINEGSILARTGDLFLVGKNVQNKGKLIAAGQLVGMMGANSLKLGKGGLFVRYYGEESDSQNPYANAFSVVEGEISNSGGKIYVLGETVGISATASLDVSHEYHPGEIFIGGDFQGKNSNLANAHWTFVEKGASIRADALSDGNGGRIIIWSDGDTVFQGGISARGWGTGIGGFAEVSGKRELHYEGDAHLQGANGHGGTLLLDPTQITITGATANVALGNCGFPGNTYASTAAAGTLSAATLAAVLNAGTSVIITTSDGTCGPFGGTGDILVTSAVSWSVMPASLTLNAARDILVRASIQESNATVTAANRVILTAARNITLGGAGFAGAAGSQNGGTLVTAVGDLLIGGAGSNYSRIGFNGNTLCQGSIVVTCNNLTMQSGNSATQIGHGRLNAASAGLITSGANITVTAAGSIAMSNASAVNSHSKIGHGSAQMGAGDNQNGDIQVISGGSLAMSGLNSAASGTTIGHGPGFGTGNLLIPFMSGNIDVRIANDFTTSSPVGFTGIGHGSRFTQTNIGALSGDIQICCGGNVSLSGPTVIRHRSTSGFAGQTISGNTNISISGNLSMSNTSPVAAGPCFIGVDLNAAQTLSGTLNLSVCGNLQISTPTAGLANFVGISYLTSLPASTSNANIVIGGNFSAANLSSPLEIGSQLDFNLAVGGNLTASMAGAGNVDGFISSGILNTTRIYVGGSLTAASTGGSILALGAPNFLTIPCANLDVRAGADIQWANNYSAPFTGSVNIQAGYSFAAGELWTGNGSSQLVSLCNQPFVPVFNLNCGSCPQFTTASSAIASLCGAFTIQGAGGPTQPLNFSTTGPLTLSSLCTVCGSGASSSLVIGAAPTGNITFAAGVGALNIGSFNTVTINQNITSTSSISVSSCSDLNVNPGFTITSGALSAITLTADIDNSGAGNLNLAGGDITSNGGLICLSAGPGTFGCNSSNCLAGISGLILDAFSSVNHTSGQINSGSGATVIVASGNITIDGAATSIITTSGPVSLTAGDTLTINEDIVSTSGAITSISGQNTTLNDSTISTAGEIRMIAGNNLSLNGATNILSSGSPVTFVVDNQFPTSPFIGTGAFNMSCSAQIQSGPGQPLRIFTALSNSNTICATALMNGFLASDPQFGLFSGLLFNDTAYQVWCTYFSCPSPYPFSGLGFPFTVFYKNCLQRVTQEAMIVVDQLLVTLHPYDEFPGWMGKFWLLYAEGKYESSNEPFMLRRRNLNLLNQPKTHTLLLPE